LGYQQKEKSGQKRKSQHQHYLVINKQKTVNVFQAKTGMQPITDYRLPISPTLFALLFSGFQVVCYQVSESQAIDTEILKQVQDDPVTSKSAF